ncbi:MAG: 2-oxoglutarate dehydrogenase complex dihydrolipoyllysine-residue succinyltransferase [Verrucomicrobiota bacterium]
MAVEVKVPTVGESITSGILGAWNKGPGEYAFQGDLLFEIETDKVTSEVFADVSGSVKHMANEGDEVEIGQVVAIIDETAAAPEIPDKAKNGSSSPTPSTEVKPAESSAKTNFELSPAVRKLVEEKGLDPADIKGTGKGGQITKEDVLNFNSSASGASAGSATLPSSSATSEKRTTRTRMSSLRRKIAQRLVSAQHEAAMLTTFNEVDMSNVMTLRKQFQDRFVAKHEIKLGFMSLFVRAVVQALKDVPNLNARLDGSELVKNHYYDIGIAVSTEKGLMVPVLRNTDQLSLAEIEKSIGAYAKKARDGKMQLDDLEGGVFSITNGGVFGSMLSTPILNPPQSGILGMHTIQERPVAVNGRVEIRPMMYLALTYDHRIVDGKEAVTFLVRVKQYIEQPAAGLLDL